MILKSVDNFSDIQRVLLSPDLIEKTGFDEIPPLPDAIYLGVYQDKTIIALMIVYKGVFHFYSVKEHRKYASKCLRMFEGFFKGMEIIFKVPKQHKTVIRFAQGHGYKASGVDPVELKKWVL